MKRLANGTATVAMSAVLILIVGADAAVAKLVTGPRGPRYQQPPSSHEFVLEGGLAEPMGDQTEDFWTTEDGFSSTTGYQLGLRIRQYLGPYFSVSPAFHYTRFGTATGVVDDPNAGGDLAYQVGISNYRYGLDFQFFAGAPESSFRMFMTGGVALINNRYFDEIQYGGTYKASINTAAYSAGLGFKMRNIELVGEYNFNRFDTTKLDYDQQNLHYNWDFLIVRLGIAFGR